MWGCGFVGGMALTRGGCGRINTCSHENERWRTWKRREVPRGRRTSQRRPTSAWRRITGCSRQRMRTTPSSTSRGGRRAGAPVCVCLLKQKGVGSGGWNWGWDEKGVDFWVPRTCGVDGAEAECGPAELAAFLLDGLIGRVDCWVDRCTTGPGKRDVSPTKDACMHVPYLAVARGLEPLEEAALVDVHDGAPALARVVERPRGGLSLPVGKRCDEAG